MFAVRSRPGQPDACAGAVTAGRGAPLPPFPIANLALGDEDLARQFWAWWVCFQAERVGISRDGITPEIAEGIRAATVGLDTDNEALAGLEKALRLIASGASRTRAGSLVRQRFGRLAVQMAAADEAATGRRRQRANARRQRPDAMQAFVLEVLTSEPAMHTKTLLQKLRSIEGLEPAVTGGFKVESVTDVIVEWSAKGTPAAETTVAALPSRISRARKILRLR